MATNISLMAQSNRVMGSQRKKLAVSLKNTIGSVWEDCGRITHQYSERVEHLWSGVCGKTRVYIEVSVYPAGNKLVVQTRAHFQQRNLAHHSFETTDPKDCADPDKIITFEIADAIRRKWRGDYSQELENTREVVNDLVQEAKTALENAERLAKVIQDPRALRRLDEIKELTWRLERAFDGPASRVRNQMETILREQQQQIPA